MKWNSNGKTHTGYGFASIKDESMKTMRPAHSEEFDDLRRRREKSRWAAAQSKHQQTTSSRKADRARTHQ